MEDPTPQEVVHFDLLPWLRDREANCRRIAETKTGDDREGWLTDASYFALAVKVIEGTEETYDQMMLREVGMPWQQP
jgi:hypothetical protein